MTNTRTPERNHPVTTAPALRVVTAEDADKARKATADLERIERLITTVLVVLGVGGLVFTAVNVTLFATGHHVHWAIAWMLDPLVSVSLLAALFIDGKLAAHGYRPGGWPFILRWFAGLSTWLMNCWGSLYPDAAFTGWPDNPDPAGLLLHSVIPFLVIILAEAGAGYRKFSMRRKGEYEVTIGAWKDQEEARRRTEAESVRRRREAESADEAAERARTAELAAQEKQAAISAAGARERAEAKAREIQATAEAEVRRAEQARLDEEARHRRANEARQQQAELDRRAAAHKADLDRQKIAAEAEAEAVKARAEAEAKAIEDAREDRRKAAEARRARTAETAPGPTAETGRGTAELTAEVPTSATAKLRKLAPVPDAQTAETDDVRGAEAKRKQIEEANFEAAVLIFMDAAPTRRQFGERYGRSESWGRERFTEADRQMAEDPDFEARVMTEAEKRTADAPKSEQVSA